MKIVIVLALFALILFCSWKALVILAGSTYLALCVLGWQLLAGFAGAIIKAVVADK